MAAPRLEAFAHGWPEGVRLLLLHGYEPGGATDNADKVCRALLGPGHPAGLERLTGEQITADPQALVAATSSFSMFGGQVIVRVDGVDERAAPALAAMLASVPGNPVIAVASGLKKSGALLTLAGKSSAIAVIEARSPDPGQFLALVQDMASEMGLRCDRAAAAALIEATSGERSLLRRELEKLALYLDASPEHQQALDIAAVAAVGAGVDSYDHAGLVMSALTGKASDVVLRLSQMPVGEGVVALRILAGRIAMLAELHRKMSNAAPEAIVAAARPPIFWKERPVFVAALRRWSARGLSSALHATLQAELSLKSRGSLGDLEAQALILRASRGR